MLGNLSEQEIREFLSREWVGHLGCHADGQTYVVPISFAFDQGRIIGQTKDGLKIDMLRKNPEACVQVDSVKSIEDWTSVIVWGKFEELKGPAAAEAMRALIDKLGPKVEELHSSRSPRDVTPGRVDGKPQVDIVYCIHVTKMTGRFERST